MAFSVDASEFVVIGPLRRLREGCAKNRFGSEGNAVASQYATCRSGGEDGGVRCFELVRSADDKRVGFIGLNMSVEDQGSRLAAFISIEFVYLRRRFRGHGLSEMFLAPVALCAKTWLRRQKRRHQSALWKLYLASSPKTDEGEVFVQRFNRLFRNSKKVK